MNDKKDKKSKLKEFFKQYIPLSPTAGLFGYSYYLKGLADPAKREYIFSKNPALKELETSLVEELIKRNKIKYNIKGFNQNPVPPHYAFNVLTREINIPINPKILEHGSFSSLNPGILAHEFGHAAMTKGKFFPKLEILNNIAGLVSPLTVIPVLKTSDEEKARKFALLGAVLGTPKVVSEGIASYKGLKMLREISKNLSRKQKIMPFIGLPTYMFNTAIPYIAYLIKKKLNYFDKNKKK